jgi:hypothetical protein
MLRIMIAIIVSGIVILAGAMNNEVLFEQKNLVFNQKDGMTYVIMPGCVQVLETGAPSLPIKAIHLVVPQGVKVTGVRAEEVQKENISGEFEVYPVQEAMSLSDQNQMRFISPAPEFYGAFDYPKQVISIGNQGSMFGYNIVSLFVSPVQYNASLKQLKFISKIRFSLEFESADLRYQPSGQRSSKARQRIESILAKFIHNPEDISQYAP